MKKGFTLIELIIAMAIIGILASVGISSYTSSLGKARDARRKGDLKAIQTALELYRQDYGKYPTTSGWEVSRSSDVSLPGTASWLSDSVTGTKLDPTYIKVLPVDPKNIGSTAPDVPNNYVYAYFSDNLCPGVAPGDFYILATRLENKNDQDGKAALISSGCSWGNGNTFVLTNP